LLAPYDRYPDSAQELLARTDHVSYYELTAYRWLKIASHTDSMLCEHCVKKRREAIIGTLRGDRTAKPYRQDVGRVFANLSPYANPDFELLDAVRQACEERAIQRLDQLTALSDAIWQLRSAQSFNAAVVLDGSDVDDNLVQRVSTVATLSSRLDARKFASDALGLRIPSEMPLEPYLELVKDYRPAIAQALNGVVERAEKPDGSVSIGDMARIISQINGEIDRVKGLKRHVFLEASVDVYRKNATMINTALIASALGLSGSLLGCAGAAAAGCAVKVAKKKSWAPHSKPLSRFTGLLKRDLQPHVNKLIAAYVGVDVPAVNVLSLRRTIESRSVAAE
jgi:hypothetical protein